MPHIDTGAMYRALALKLLREHRDVDDEVAVAEVLDSTTISLEDGKVVLDGSDVSDSIRTNEVTAASSHVAQLGAVRRWMVDRQRAIAAASPGAVVEGRDIGTVVLPDADLKIYLDATPQERARRRALETGWDPAATAAEISSRDTRDALRKHSPLKPAADAVVLDTTDLSVEEVVDRILEIVDGLGGL